MSKTIIRLNRRNFLESLQVGGAFAWENKLLPILECVKITIKNGKMRIVSYNQETAVSINMDKMDECIAASFCIAYKALNSYIQLLPCNEVVLEYDDEAKMVEVKHNNGSTKLPAFDVIEFPDIPKTDSINQIQMDGSQLAEFIAESYPFCMEDTLHPIISSVHIYAKDGLIGCQATDGHGLISDRNPYNGAINANFILKKTECIQIAKMVDGIGELTVKIGSSNVIISADGINILSRNVIGNYPNLQRILDIPRQYSATIERRYAVDAIKRCRLSSDKIDKLIRMDFSKDNLEIVSQDIMLSLKTNESIPCECDGTVIISVKYELLLSCLMALSSEKVDIQFQDKKTSILLKEANTDSNKTMVLMPYQTASV